MCLFVFLLSADMCSWASIAVSQALSLDVEYGNADSFYSGCSHKGSGHLGAPLNKSINAEWAGSLTKTDISVQDKALLSDAGLLRTVNFNIVSDSSLFDLVSRFVVYSKSPRPGYINGQSFPHADRNFYRQFPVKNNVKVPISDIGYLNFESLAAKVPAGFNEVFYIRGEGVSDLGFKWIVHHRLIVDPAKAKLILRSCNPRFEGPLPLNSIIPRWVKRPFFRIRENRCPNFPVMAVGEITLLAGGEASLTTQVRLTNG